MAHLLGLCPTILSLRMPCLSTSTSHSSKIDLSKSIDLTQLPASLRENGEKTKRRGRQMEKERGREIEREIERERERERICYSQS